MSLEVAFVCGSNILSYEYVYYTHIYIYITVVHFEHLVS